MDSGTSLSALALVVTTRQLWHRLASTPDYGSLIVLFALLALSPGNFTETAQQCFAVVCKHYGHFWFKGADTEAELWQD